MAVQSRRINMESNRKTVIKMQGKLNSVIFKSYEKKLYKGTSTRKTRRNIFPILIQYNIFYSFFHVSVAVIICFLICWTPYHALRIMFVITSKMGLRSQKLLEMEDTLYLISGIIFSSLVNVSNMKHSIPYYDMILFI